MKLHNHLMLWMALTSALPLLLLVAAVTYYQQQSFIESVDIEMQAELNRLTTKLEEQLLGHNDILESLAQSEPVRQFGKVHQRTLTSGQVYPEYFYAREHLYALLTNLRGLVASDAVFRVMDASGNSLLKSSGDLTVQPSFEALTPYPLQEAEADPQLQRILDGLPSEEISYRSLSRWIHRESAGVLPDLIRPVHTATNSRIYLSFSHRGAQFDRLLDLSPRHRNAKLSLLASDSILSPHPQLLYDDMRQIKFTDANALRAPDSSHSPDRHQQISDHIFETSKNGTRIYFSDYLPYPDSFETWRLISKLDRKELLHYFDRLRFSTVLAALALLLTSALMALYGSRRIAAPICRLAKNIRAYTNQEALLPDYPPTTSEVRDLQQAFTEMIQRLEHSRNRHQKAEQSMLKARKLASIGEMAAGIGHELNNPLNNIISLTKLMKSSVKGNRGLGNDVESIREEALRASKIVAGILNFAREVKLKPRWFNAKSWLQGCADRVSELAQTGKISLELNAPETLNLYGDADLLEQVMINLLTNAIQSSPDASLVTVNIARQEMISLSVRDHGDGIEDANAGRLFEPFVTTKPVGEGSGLGLAISLGIVASHDGTITLQNHPQGGCVAEILLPAGPEQETL